MRSCGSSERSPLAGVGSVRAKPRTKANTTSATSAIQNALTANAARGRPIWFVRGLARTALDSRVGGVACLDVAEEDPISADPGADDLAEGVLVPDVVEPATRPAVECEGGGLGLVDAIGPSGGSGRAFEVLTDIDGSIVVRLMGELDVSAVPELEAAVGRVLSATGSRLVVDVRELEFADSSAIALWVRWANQAAQVEIRHPSAVLRGRIFRMGLSDRFRLTP